MADNRLDKKIRNVLEERTISPTEASWRKLEGQLEALPPVGKKGYFRYAIAAGFTGVALVSLFYFSMNSDPIPPIEEVVKSTVEVEDNVPPVDAPSGSLKQAEVVATNSPDKIKESHLLDEQGMGQHVTKEVLPEIHRQEAGDIDGWVPIDKLDVKVAEIVAKVELLEDSGESVKDEVVDSLLRAAQRQILHESSPTNPAKIDALALLADVEGELNQTFRDQLFEKLKEGYLKVRTTLAYRNE